MILAFPTLGNLPALLRLIFPNLGKRPADPFLPFTSSFESSALMQPLIKTVYYPDFLLPLTSFNFRGVSQS